MKLSKRGLVIHIASVVVLSIAGGCFPDRSGTLTNNTVDEITAAGPGSPTLNMEEAIDMTYGIINLTTSAVTVTDSCDATPVLGLKDGTPAEVTFRDEITPAAPSNASVTFTRVSANHMQITVAPVPDEQCDASSLEPSYRSMWD